MARILIGTSGWHYQSWRGPFFPSDLLTKDTEHSRFWAAGERRISTRTICTSNTKVTSSTPMSSAG